MWWTATGSCSMWRMNDRQSATQASNLTGWPKPRPIISAIAQSAGRISTCASSVSCWRTFTIRKLRSAKVQSRPVSIPCIRFRCKPHDRLTAPPKEAAN
jgi:hypothetical protein